MVEAGGGGKGEKTWGATERERTSKPTVGAGEEEGSHEYGAWGKGSKWHGHGNKDGVTIPRNSTQNLSRLRERAHSLVDVDRSALPGPTFTLVMSASNVTADPRRVWAPTVCPPPTADALLPCCLPWPPNTALSYGSALGLWLRPQR